MNVWARMLAELPATGQRVIARAQRISLPRRCDAATRQLRLRQSLCHAATVRAMYALLDPTTQAALQHLRAEHGGIGPNDLAKRYGTLRTWRALAADPHPRTLSEQLLLLGWLLPRPATPRHPSRYLIPPEVRRWLPVPLPALHSDEAAPAAPSAHLPAPRAATALLLAAANQPLPVTRAGSLRRATLRQLAPRLAPLDPNDGAALLAWLTPLLIAHDLLSCHHGTAALTIAGQRFLTLPPAQQHAQLHAAWIRSPDPDPWLWRLRVDLNGIDWPLLRRRLCMWARAIPADDMRDPATRYAELARSFGPLADAQTHGFRTVDRAPWQPKRASAVLHAALHGPLTWLGLIGAGAIAHPEQPGDTPAPSLNLTPIAAAQHRMRNPPRPPGPQHRRVSHWCWPATDQVTPSAAHAAATDAITALPNSIRWRYHAPGVISVPHAAPPAVTLRLVPFAAWEGADASATYYRISAASLARARSQGSSATACRQLVDQHAGPLPAGWCPALESPPPTMRLVATTVLMVDTPALLVHAGRTRSIRRYLDQRIAPGIALVHPDNSAPLRRALARHGIACLMVGAEHDDNVNHNEAHPVARARPHVAVAAGPAGAAPYAPEFSPGERAALLIACAQYRQHAPPDAPLLPHDALEARLRAGLTPPLRAAVEAALAALCPPPSEAQCMQEPMEPAPLARTLHSLRAALEQQRPLDVTYDSAGQGVLSTRTIRPLALEQRADTWYLRAYCSTRQAERTFRVDRIWAIADG